MNIVSSNCFAVMCLTVILSGCGVVHRPGQWHAPVIDGYEVNSGSADVIEVCDDDSFEDRPVIPKKVVELGHNQNYIIAKQEEFQKIFDGVRTRETLIPGQYKYWILDVKTDSIWGPLELDEYVDKRDELGVNSDLVLVDVYEYNK